MDIGQPIPEGALVFANVKATKHATPATTHEGTAGSALVVPTRGQFMGQPLGENGLPEGWSVAVTPTQVC